MSKTRKILTAAMLAALTCVATLINIPSADGYKNLGDCILILSGCMLGPIYGAAAAGIGSALADLILGYAYYIPGTLIIKALMGLLMGVVFASTNKKVNLRLMLAMVIAEIIMVAGYFIYSVLLLGNFESALASIPGNILQGVIGIVGAALILKIFEKNKAIKKFFE